MIITNDDGEQVEVFTADDLAAQKQQALDEYMIEHPDKGDEIAALQADLKAKEDALAKMDEKDQNFSLARKQAQDKVEDILKGVDEKIDAAKKEVLEGVMQDHYAETLKTLSDGDDELKKKIEYHYKRLTDTASTKEEVTVKLRDAYLLATKPAETDALNTSVLSSGGVSRIKVGSEKKFTEEEKAFTKKLAQAGGMTLEESDFK